MPQVRSNVGAKWARRAGSAAQEYQEGVQNPRASWQAATVAAEAAHNAGIQAAIQAKSFVKGVQKAGDAAWAKGATTKGVERFAGGVAAGQSSYETGVQPYLAAISSTTLPPRGPKGDPRNIERVRVMNQALRKVKTSGAA